jgi:hypothetical protein
MRARDKMVGPGEVGERQDEVEDVVSGSGCGAGAAAQQAGGGGPL